jgi:hypothetical protein
MLTPGAPPCAQPCSACCNFIEGIKDQKGTGTRKQACELRASNHRRSLASPTVDDDSSEGDEYEAPRKRARRSSLRGEAAS